MRFTKHIAARGRILGGGREPLVCTPLIGVTADAIRLELRNVVPRRPDLLEWRVDHFHGVDDPAGVIEMAFEMRQLAGEIPVILTLRSSREGGQAVSLDEGQVVALYAAACKSGAVDFVDFELSARGQHIEQVRGMCRDSGTGLILSYHNFEETPDVDYLGDKFRQARDLGGDIAKIAVMPRNAGDVLTLLDATLRSSRSLEIPLIGVSMGSYGALTRAIGWVFGSAVTFAVGQGCSAPGQMPLEELQDVLSIMRRALDAERRTESGQSAGD